MPQLIPIKLDDNTVIYIETTEDVEAPSINTEEEEEEEEEVAVGKGMSTDALRKQMLQNFQVVEHTIRAYTTYSLNAFKKLAIANVNKVTLEFGIEIGGEGGIPYVTKGTAKSNLKITVECSFPENNQNQNP